MKTNPRSNVFRGMREYIERRQTVVEAGKIRVKISPDCEYISIRGADVAPMLQRIAEKQIRHVGSTPPVKTQQSVSSGFVGHGDSSLIPSEIPF